MINQNKMTAVEWLVEEIQRLNDSGYEFHPKYNEEIIAEAKVMEQQEKIEFACQVAEASAMKYIQGKTTWQIAEELLTIKSE